jgi:hypothetical protein
MTGGRADDASGLFLLSDGCGAQIEKRNKT